MPIDRYWKFVHSEGPYMHLLIGAPSLVLKGLTEIG